MSARRQLPFPPSPFYTTPAAVDVGPKNSLIDLMPATMRADSLVRGLRRERDRKEKHRLEEEAKAAREVTCSL